MRSSARYSHVTWIGKYSNSPRQLPCHYSVGDHPERTGSCPLGFALLHTNTIVYFPFQRLFVFRLHMSIMHLFPRKREPIGILIGLGHVTGRTFLTHFDPFLIGIRTAVHRGNRRKRLHLLFPNRPVKVFPTETVARIIRDSQSLLFLLYIHTSPIDGLPFRKQRCARFNMRQRINRDGKPLRLVLR